MTLKPFEICSIRPPTENQSLTFRLTRNCYWNKCTFCPVYKLGARFSRRSIDDIKADIEAARRLNIMLDGSSGNTFHKGRQDPATLYQNARKLVQQLQASSEMATETGAPDSPATVNSQWADDPQVGWFMQWFKDNTGIADSIDHLVNWRLGGGRNCFLGDADSLILTPDFLKEVIDAVRCGFPSIHRFTVYGRTVTAARIRSLAEMRAFRQAGLNRVHYGVESGSDTVLKNVRKGESKDDHITGCLKTKEAGLSCSIYVMPGLGGQQFSKEHAEETADMITRAAPDFVRLRTLQVFAHSPLAGQLKSGTFQEASEEQVVLEIRRMVEKIDAPTQIMSDSATNLLQVNGRLPEDRLAMLNIIDAYLVLARMPKKIFSLQARLEAFQGQYGGFSEDIYTKLIPFVTNGELDIEAMPEPKIDELILLIRSKLMP